MISKINADLNQELRTSILILKETANSLKELTHASLEAYRLFTADKSQVNQVILSSVYAFLIIKACTFQDELNIHFLKINTFQEDKDLNKGVLFYNGLFENFDIRDFRIYLSHNRKVQHIQRQHKKVKEYHYISDEDIKRLELMKSHSEYNGFDVGAAMIIKAIDRLYDSLSN